MVVIYTLLTYLSLSPDSSAADIPKLWQAGAYIRDAVGGAWSVNAAWIFAFVVHTLEAMYTFVLVRRHRTGFLLGVSEPRHTF